MCIIPERLRDFLIPLVTLNRRTIAFVTVQKYLGVLINNDLNDNDINQLIRSIYCAGNILTKKFKGTIHEKITIIFVLILFEFMQ